MINRLPYISHIEKFLLVFLNLTNGFNNFLDPKRVLELIAKTSISQNTFLLSCFLTLYWFIYELLIIATNIYCTFNQIFFFIWKLVGIFSFHHYIATNRRYFCKLLFRAIASLTLGHCQPNRISFIGLSSALMLLASLDCWSIYPRYTSFRFCCHRPALRWSK